MRSRKQPKLWRGPTLGSTAARAGLSFHKLVPIICCRDLYIVFVLKVLESYNYFSLSRIFVLFLTEVRSMARLPLAVAAPAAVPAACCLR